MNIIDYTGKLNNHEEYIKILQKIKASKELFDYLTQYETFCKYYEYGTTPKSLSRGDYSEITDFGYDDIAFYDKKDEILLCTTTHEGYISISDAIVQ